MATESRKLQKRSRISILTGPSSGVGAGTVPRPCSIWGYVPLALDAVEIVLTLLPLCIYTWQVAEETPSRKPPVSPVDKTVPTSALLVAVAPPP
jgi:hypothetical protein